MLLMTNLVVFCILFLGCKSSVSPSSEYMILDEVAYIDSFPQTYSLKDGVQVEMPVIGIKNFVIYDTLLIASVASSAGYWSIISLPALDHLGSFIRNGNGPNEFPWLPSVISHANFYKEDERLMAGLIDPSRGRLYKVDIDSSIQTKRLHISVLKDSLPQYLFSFIMVDSVTFFCREIASNNTQLNRYLLKNENREVPKTFEKLNNARIREREDCNILSAIIKYNAERNLFVEMPIGLNHINIYSPDDTFGKTICVGATIDDIEKIQDRKRFKRLYTYAHLRLYDQFFGVLHINEEEMIFQTNRKRLPNIQLFDWEGNPIVKIQVDRFITAFDIDFINGNLYTLDHQTDEIYKYDIHDMLDKLH